MKEKHKDLRPKLPRPVLGSVLLELIPLDYQEYMNRKSGIDIATENRLKKSGLIIAHAEATEEKEQQVTGRAFKLKDPLGTPIKKGKVLELALDAFGINFAKHYGEDAAKASKPKIGDIVYFVPGKFFEVDFERKYGLIRDEDVRAIEAE